MMSLKFHGYLEVRKLGWADVANGMAMLLCFLCVCIGVCVCVQGIPPVAYTEDLLMELWGISSTLFVLSCFFFSWCSLSLSLS